MIREKYCSNVEWTQVKPLSFDFEMTDDLNTVCEDDKPVRVRFPTPSPAIDARPNHARLVRKGQPPNL